MSTFISHNPTDAESKTVNNPDSFYPGLETADFREKHKIDDSVTTARLAHYLFLAMSVVNHDMSDFKHVQIKLNNTALNGDKKSHYEAAIFYHAKALIIESYRDIDTTGDGHEKADAMDEKTATLYQRSRKMQSLVTGKSDVRITLI